MTGARRDRLPWDIVETIPSTDLDVLGTWQRRLDAAEDRAQAVRGRIGVALALYWAAHTELVDGSFEDVAETREVLVNEALEAARDLGDPTLLAEAILGVLYATWRPQLLLTRRPHLDDLARLRPEIDDEELRYRIDEWHVLDALDRGDLPAALARIDSFTRATAETDLVMFHRREVLWRANVAMLTGELDTAVRMNQEIVAATSEITGTPFSFQNMAITVAIERFLRRGLADVIEAIRSIRASSPRVQVNWDVGLAFSLSQIGELDEASTLYQPLAAAQFTTVPQDLNWLVTMHLLALVALALDDSPRCRLLYDLLVDYAPFDATHGSGYASYGPMGRVVGSLAARSGLHAAANSHFDHVLSTRSPGPWTALTRLDRARELAHVRPRTAMDDARQAEEELRSLGLDAWAREAEAVATRLELAGHGGPIATLEDGTWVLRHHTGRALVADGSGVRHLLELLRRPGETMDVRDLAGVPSEIQDEGVTEAVLDRQAQTAYRRRLREIGHRGEGDDEIGFLRRQLAGGSFTPSSSAEVERVRIRVTKGIRRAIGAIELECPDLGRHLQDSIETGRHCTYGPQDGTAWRIVR